MTDALHMSDTGHMEATPAQSAGLYVHVPFCASKCHYCDFFSKGMTDSKGALRGHFGRQAEEYVETLLSEYKLRREEVDGPFSTLYIGGGTPSLLPQPLLCRLLDALSTDFGQSVRPMTEVTVEANPEHVTPQWLEAIAKAGANRISIGVQSFDDNFLNIIGRRHNAQEAILALERLTQSGINYSADLIYGLPRQELSQWADDLDRLLAFRPSHFSAYLLSYEPGTRLYARMLKGEIAPAEEDLAHDMYTHLCSKASRMGYHHYEISNFALPGREARHNSSYWNLTPYVGLGCGAHSFDGISRRYNPLNIPQYIASISAGTTYALIEPETIVNQINDYIITSLRTDSGLDMQLIADRWGSIYAAQVNANIKPLLQSAHLHRINDSETGRTATPRTTYIIPEAQWLTADAVLREVILDDLE